MTASTQTTSGGWYYADSDSNPGAASNESWDGRQWPEIQGYLGHDAYNPEEFAAALAKAPLRMRPLLLALIVLALVAIAMVVGVAI